MSTLVYIPTLEYTYPLEWTPSGSSVLGRRCFVGVDKGSSVIPPFTPSSSDVSVLPSVDRLRISAYPMMESSSTSLLSPSV